METLQLIPLEDLGKYLDKSGYVIVPVNRKQLDKAREGILEPDDYLSAYKDVLFLRIAYKLLKDGGSPFLLLLQDSVLEYFKEVIVIGNEEKPKSFEEKNDDGFEEYRLFDTIKVDIVGYSVLRKNKLDKDEWGDGVIGRPKVDGIRY